MENNKAESKQKNSIIEILRFIFAINVVKSHGFCPYRDFLFVSGRLSVEFFFVLSGYLFVKSIKKYVENEKTVLKNIECLYIDKFKKLGLPLFIALAFNLIYKIIFKPDSIGIWNYLWYVHDLLIVFSTYICLKKLFKKEKVFIVSIIIITLLFGTFRLFEPFSKWGTFRSFTSVGLGFLIAKVPKIKNKIILNIVFTISLLFAFRMIWFDFTLVEELILTYIGYPLLIYTAFQINFYFKFFNYLGSLSFGLYAFQSVAKFIKAMGIYNTYVLFIIIFLLTIIDKHLPDFIIHLKRHKMVEE